MAVLHKSTDFMLTDCSSPPSQWRESKSSGIITNVGLQCHLQEEENCSCGQNDTLQEEKPEDYPLQFVSLLTKCAKEKDLCKGIRLHAQICKEELLLSNTLVGNASVNMYAKCGDFLKAQEVLDELPGQDVISWNALITGFVQNEHTHEALKCFDRMQKRKVSPNTITFLCILKACGTERVRTKGEQLHAEINRQQLLGKDINLGNALVDMYAKCGALSKAHEVFDELPVRDVVSWNTMIAAYIHHGCGQEALNCFEQMQKEYLHPNDVTLICTLNACSSVGALEKGKELHALVIRWGLFEKNASLGNSLLDLHAKHGILTRAQELFDKLPVRSLVSWNVLIAAYAKCGAIMKAKELFDELQTPDVVSWSTLIAGYVEHGHGHEALECFECMQLEGPCPNAVTFMSILKACGNVGRVEKGEEIHAEIVRRGLLGKDIVLGNVLVDMYAKCGAVEKAQEVFDELPVQDQMSWNALVAGYAKCGAFSKARVLFDDLPVHDVIDWNVLIAGYAQHGHSLQVFTCCEEMRHEGLSPNAVTFLCILMACSIIGAAEKGQETYGKLCRQGMLKSDIKLGNALMDMFVKCGLIAKAIEVFKELPVKSVVTWTVLMAGYAQLEVESVFITFDKMVGDGLEPDATTFVVLLNACSHSGLVDVAEIYFIMMKIRYYITPTIEHHTCLIDLFGRMGNFDWALRVIKKITLPDSYSCLPLWSALLNACGKWGNSKIGKLAFGHAVPLDETDATAYACMCNVYVAGGVQEETRDKKVMRVND